MLPVQAERRVVNVTGMHTTVGMHVANTCGRLFGCTCNPDIVGRTCIAWELSGGELAVAAAQGYLWGLMDGAHLARKGEVS